MCLRSRFQLLSMRGQNICVLLKQKLNTKGEVTDFVSHGKTYADTNYL